MTDTLTPSQTLLLWRVLAKQGLAAWKDMMPAPKAADRKALQAAKLIGVSKGARGALVLELEDRGWAWAAAHLRDPLPPAQGTLQAMMGLLHDHLSNAHESLADFIGTPPPPSFRGGEAEPGTQEPKTQRPRSQKRSPGSGSAPKARPGLTKVGGKPKPAPETKLSIREEIERAYLAVTGKKTGVAAKLSEIRPHLAHMDRTAVDAALVEIRRGDPKARLLRMDDQRSITPADAAAALPFAGEHLHILWITK